jgi:hypothetical protein
MTYDPSDLGDIPETNLSLYYYDESANEWIAVSGSVNDAENTITAQVNHFTEFGIFAKTTLPYTGL